jgi:hypothetical protein
MVAGVALMAGVSVASATSTTVTTTTAAPGGAVTIDPAEETEVRTYVTKQNWRSVDVPGTVAVGTELPASVELHTVPNVTKYRATVVGGRTVLVDPGTRRVVRVIER